MQMLESISFIHGLMSFLSFTEAVEGSEHTLLCLVIAETIEADTQIRGVC